jgi:hypothetical protein
MRSRLANLGLIVTLLAASGCAHTFDASTLGVEATMASPTSAPAEGERFEIPGSQPSLNDVLASQSTSVQRVADLRVRVRSRFTDVLLTVLTAGLIVPRSVTYEGVIVGQ